MGTGPQRDGWVGDRATTRGVKQGHRERDRDRERGIGTGTETEGWEQGHREMDRDKNTEGRIRTGTKKEGWGQGHREGYKDRNTESRIRTGTERERDRGKATERKGQEHREREDVRKKNATERVTMKGAQKAGWGGGMQRE